MFNKSLLLISVLARSLGISDYKDKEIVNVLCMKEYDSLILCVTDICIYKVHCI